MTATAATQYFLVFLVSFPRADPGMLFWPAGAGIRAGRPRGLAKGTLGAPVRSCTRDQFAAVQGIGWTTAGGPPKADLKFNVPHGCLATRGAAKW